jgi:hypothetical protein
MIDFSSLDIDDGKLLGNSYEAIKQKDCLEIITGTEKEKIFQQTINSIRTPAGTKDFTFQNLFKITLNHGHFYIAQVFIDFGNLLSTRGFPTSHYKHTFQLIGIANCKINLGITYFRPETKIDKFLDRFFHNDINFDESEKFNDKYYLVSNQKEIIQTAFDKTFLNTIAKYENLLLTTNNNEMYISFDTSLEDSQSKAVEDIFSNFKFLAD